jgi:hypothetical protein
MPTGVLLDSRYIADAHFQANLTTILGKEGLST